MPKLAAFFLAGLVCCTAVAEPYDLDPVLLTVDAEHYGALLDKNVPLYFYPTGELRSGVLKADFNPYGDLVLAAGNSIVFHKNGTVASGMLKNRFKGSGFEFLPAPISFYPDGQVSEGRAASISSANVSYNGQANLTLRQDGTIATIEAVLSPPQFRILGRWLQQTAGLRFDPASKTYRLVSGVTAGNDSLIGVFITARRNQLTSSAIPVIVPKSTRFEMPEANGKAYETWSINNMGLPVVFNGWNFGTNPVFLIRNMHLVGVRVTQPVKLDEYQFKTNDTVFFDGSGKILPPQL